MVKKPRKPIHPKVKAAGGAGGAAAAVVVIAQFFGLELPPAVAEAAVVLVAFVGGYLKSA